MNIEIQFSLFRINRTLDSLSRSRSFEYLNNPEKISLKL